MLLACRLPAASSAAGARAFLRTWLITPGLPSAAPRSAAPRWASPPRCSRRNMSFMSTTHFFLPLRGAGRLAPHGAGDPFDCGRRARKSRWKATPATNRRGSSCWSRKSRRCGLGTRSGSVRSPLRRLPAPPSPSPTLPSPSPHRHRRSRQPCHRYRRHRRIPVRRRRRPRCHRHRPRRHGLRHPLPGRRRRLRRLRLRLCRRCPARSVRLCRPRRPRHYRGTRRLSHSIAPHRDGSIGVRNVNRHGFNIVDFG